ncbi:MAG TPA: ABC transporter substrate-binding protein [Actinopolymorphaceae bacterium]|nr:ABC transporter substrate-binding protein [Actinopolymorphaceae bacterium]
MTSRRSLLRGAALLPLAGSLSGCSFGADLLGVRRTVRVAVSWSAAELAAFRGVLDGLDHLPGQRPKDYSVEVVPLGDDIPTAVTARGAGRVDVVMLPVPGLVAENLGALERLPDGIWPGTDLSETYAPVWHSLLFHADAATGVSVPYGLPFKLAHDSLVWYRACLFDQLGLRPPTNWSEWLAVNDAIVARGGGVAPLALGGADGWMLTGVFQNILLARSPCAYDLLSRQGPGRPRPWDLDEVRDAFRLLGQMWGAPGALAGGVKGSLVQQFPDAVLEVFHYHRAAMVVVPDFAEPFAERYRADPPGCVDDVGVFAFPRVGAGVPPLIAGGDVAVLTKPAGDDAKDLLRRLADERAPLPWITGNHGFIAANRKAPQSFYTTVIEPFARQLHDRTFRFDLADQIGAVGGREGLWRVLQDFLARVGDGQGSRAEEATDRAIEHLLALEDASVESATDATRRNLARSQTATAIRSCARDVTHGD